MTRQDRLSTHKSASLSGWKHNLLGVCPEPKLLMWESTTSWLFRDCLAATHNSLLMLRSFVPNAATLGHHLVQKKQWYSLPSPNAAFWVKHQEKLWKCTQPASKCTAKLRLQTKKKSAGVILQWKARAQWHITFKSCHTFSQNRHINANNSHRQTNSHLVMKNLLRPFKV